MEWRGLPSKGAAAHGPGVRVNSERESGLDMVFVKVTDQETGRLL